MLSYFDFQVLLQYTESGQNFKVLSDIISGYNVSNMHVQKIRVLVYLLIVITTLKLDKYVSLYSQTGVQLENE